MADDKEHQPDSTPPDFGPTRPANRPPPAIPYDAPTSTGAARPSQSPGDSAESATQGSTDEPVTESGVSIPPGLIVGRKVGLGRFTLTRELGRGGMGVVWLARDERLKQDVALKLLPPEVAADETALDDLRRETLKSQQLVHTHIVSIRDLHETPGEPPFILMEYVDGPNLRNLLRKQPQRCFTWEFLRPLVEQLCSALEYAHGEKVIHRDLKPGNLMLDSRNRLRLADFGIAATISDSVSRVSRRGHETSGTLTYMSPQQMDGQRPRISDDIYSLGATLYELLTGTPPFFSGGTTAIIHQVHNVPPTPLPERLKDIGVTNEIPPQVNAAILACLAKERDDRPQTASALWTRLNRSRKTPAKTAATPKPAAITKPAPAPASPRGENEAKTPRRKAVEVERVSEPAPAPRPTPGPLANRRMKLAAIGLVVLICVALAVTWSARTGRDKNPAALQDDQKVKPLADNPATNISPAPVPPTLPALAELNLSVFPPQAELFSNGVSLGHLSYPVTLKGPASQRIILEARLDGYSNATKTVVFPIVGLSSNETLELRPRIVLPQMSAVSLNVQPSGAELFTNGFSLGHPASPFLMRSLAGQRLNIEARLAGYSNATLSLLFPPYGKSAQASLVLQPKPVVALTSEIAISVLPAEAELLTNGVSAGHPVYPLVLKGQPGRELVLEARLENYSNTATTVYFPGAGGSAKESLVLRAKPVLPKTSEIVITVQPADAELFTNGISAGHPSYPFTLKGLIGQPINVEARLEGYLNATLSINFPEAGQSTRQKLVLRPKPIVPQMSELIINVQPAEAELFTNGASVGHPAYPFLLKGLVGGKTTLEARLDGYYIGTKTAIFPGLGLFTNELIVLQPKPGILIVHSDPSAPSVLFSNAAQVLTATDYGKGVELKPGLPFQVSITTSNYLTATTNAEALKPGETRNLDFGALTLKPAALRLKVEPRDSSVSIIYQGKAAISYGTSNLIEGIHPDEAFQLVVAHNNFTPQTNSITLRPAEIRTYEPIKLKPVISYRWTNSLGMVFVAVSGTKVLFSVWDTRVRDYAAYAAANSDVDKSWKSPKYHDQAVTPRDTCPVVDVNWEEAQAFCTWLTEKERNAGLIGSQQVYRLPRDAEWSAAAGLKESATALPRQKNGRIKDHYPWGAAWPPPKGAGNYEDKSMKARFNVWSVIEGYDDGYATTSPVGSFAPNNFGLYDMGGNVWQWCEDWYDDGQNNRVLRGGSWFSHASDRLLSSFRNESEPANRTDDFGFRCVLADEFQP